MIVSAARSAVWAWGKGLLFGAGFVSLFWPTFGWMAERFNSVNSFYSHGWVVPIASAWLIWRFRESLKEVPRKPSSRGLLLLVPSILIHLVATEWRLGFVSGFAMLGTIWGLVWTLWGWPMLYRLRFPLLFLLFMVPLPGILLIHTSFKMKLWAAGMATQILPWIGVPATQAGSSIFVPGLEVVVDDTCSGLRSLISLIALSTLWTSFLPPSSHRWQRGLLVVSSIPIALVANMARILTVVLLSTIYGPQVAESFIHFGSGLLVFGLALAALLGLSNMVEKWSPSSVIPQQSLS